MNEKETKKGLSLDQLHLDYAKEVMFGKMQAKDFIFSTDRSVIKTLRELKPTMFVGNPLYFLSAFEYLLRDPKNLAYIPQILRFWENNKLYSSAAYALSSLYKTMCERSKIGYSEENRTLYEHASKLVQDSLLQNQTAVSPDAFALLSSMPLTAMEKLSLLMGGHDYSSFMSGCDSKDAASRYICKYLMEQGLIRNIKILCAYIDKITPDEMSTSVEIALQHSLTEAIKHKEKLTSEEYCRLSKAIKQLPQASALNIWEKIIKNNMVQETHYQVITPHAVDEEVKTNELNMVINDLRLYAEKEQDIKVTISVVRLLNPIESQISDSISDSVAISLAKTSPENIENGIEILNFIKLLFDRKEGNIPPLRRCIKVLSQTYKNFNKEKEVSAFKSWAVNKIKLWEREGLEEDDDEDFLDFFEEDDNLTNWEKALYALLWDKKLKEETRKYALSKLIEKHKDEKPKQLADESLLRLMSSGVIIPQAWL